MTNPTTGLSDLVTWLRGSGLELVLVVLGLVLAIRAVAAFGSYATRWIDAGDGDPISRSEQEKHRHALVQVGVWLMTVVMASLATVRVIKLLGFSITGLVAPAAVLGVALGFGAQRIVQDLLAGFFLLAERQYGYGDVVRISALGSTTGVTGTVEEISLRITRMRSSEGEVIIIPNGQIVQVTNLSRDWARAIVDVPLRSGEDVEAAIRRLRDLASQAYKDAALSRLLLDEPVVTGVESTSGETLNVRVVARTRPGRQFEVSRALRTRILPAMRRPMGERAPEKTPAKPPAAEHDDRATKAGS